MFFEGFYGGVLWVIVFILWIIALIDVWKGPKETGAKVLWTLLILIFPLIGVIIYYIFGRR